MSLLPLLFGVFLIVHGLIHLWWLAPLPDDPKNPFTFKSPFVKSADALSDPLRTVGRVLVVTAAVALTLAGLDVLGVPLLAPAWRILAVLGALDSLAIIVLFWNRQFFVGVLLDVGIIALAFMGWPHA